VTQVPEQKEKKSRFAVSREVRAEFTAGVAGVVTELAQAFHAGDKPPPVRPPFCPVSGYPYAGANMTRLMLESMKRGYGDDRWLTFQQLQKFKFDNNDASMLIRKGEKGVKLLRAESVAFHIDATGKWNFLTEEQEKALKQKGGETKIQRRTLFHPYTVFNASQIEEFPPKENPAPALTVTERNALIDNFIACAGMVVEHGHERAFFDRETNVIKMPAPEKFRSTDDYYAAKLLLAFHASGHAEREKRDMDNGTRERMCGEAFSLLAGARFGLPLPKEGGVWPEAFRGTENKAAFEAAADAGRLLVLMEQFRQGDQPHARWFPKQQEWPALSAAQEARNQSQEPEAAAPRMRMR
jgi:antirestriction protein ArdC